MKEPTGKLTSKQLENCFSKQQILVYSNNTSKLHISRKETLSIRATELHEFQFEVKVNVSIFNKLNVRVTFSMVAIYI